MRRLIAAIAVLLATGMVGFGREVAITILHTCDLHGHILPTESYEGETNVGGLARCATMIRQVRAEQPRALLVDAGDTLQGEPVSYLSGGQAMVKALNALHYDAWVWGNHEFDWGLKKLVACGRQARMPVLNANVQAGVTGLARQVRALVKPFIIGEVDGVKVAIIGLNTPGIPNWSRSRLIEGLEFTDSVATLKTVIPAVRKRGAQVLVLVCHQGFREGGDDHANQINAIARNFPELDVIIGGHTHRNFSEFKVSGILYCQAEYYGIHLGRVDLVFDTATGKVMRRSAKTLKMDDRVAVDAELTGRLSAELDKARQAKATVIGEATGEFSSKGGPKHETAIHNLIFEAVAAGLRERGVKVDAMVHGLLEHRAVIPPGRVTEGQIWKLVPYENTIGVLELTPGQLREILDENAAAYEKSEFRGIMGLKWAFDANGPQNARTVTLSHADGTPVGVDERLRVAFNSYELASGGLRWKKLRELADNPATHLVEYDLETRQAVVEYFQKQGKVVPVVKGWWEKRRQPSRVTPAGK